MGVCLSEEGLREVRWQLDIRAWLPTDWAKAAGVHSKTVYVWLSGGYVYRSTAAKLNQAFVDNRPIKGLAEILQQPEVMAL